MLLRKCYIGCLIGLLLTACTGQTMLSPDESRPEDRIQVTFTLALGGPASHTRAGWDNYQPSDMGDSYDNRIDPAQLQVLVYDAASGTGEAVNHTCLGEVKSLALIPTAQPNVYQFIGSLEVKQEHLAADGKLHARLAVFANWSRTVSAGEGLTDLKAVTYSYPASCIPMWGVKTIDMALTPGRRTDIGAIDLLRAMAKIKLQLKAEAVEAGYRIQSATLSRYHTTGCCLPAGYEAVDDTKALDLDGVMHIPGPVTVATELPFQDGVLYVPEYAHNGNEATIAVTLQKEGTAETVSGTIRFVDYQNGRPVATATPYDIIRNHFYRYTLGVVDEQLQVNYVVAPWDEVHTSDIGWDDVKAFQFEFKSWKSDENAVEDKGDEEARYCYVTRPAYKDGSGGTVLKSGSGSASFSFKLTAPKGISWKAHLSDTENFEFSSGTYKVDGTTYHRVASGIAREQRYQIQINAKNNWTNPLANADGTETTQDLNVNATLTSTAWGQQWGQLPHPITRFSITVCVDGVTDIPLEINPEVTAESGKNNYKHTFTVNGVEQTVYREYAGTATEIQIRQIKIEKAGQSSQELAYKDNDRYTDFPYYYGESPLLKE